MIDGSNYMPTPGGWDDFHNRDYYPVYPGRSFLPGQPVALTSRLPWILHRRSSPISTTRSIG